MTSFLKKLLTTLAFLIPLSSCANESTLPSVHVTQGKYSNYYHIQYTLDNSNFEFSKDENGKSYTEYTEVQLAEAGGQFEILIPVNDFPVRSENCKNSIKARMPWSDSSSKSQATGLLSKQELFTSLRGIKKNKQGEINVVLELNPYVKTSESSTQGVVLTGCNVFFRHANGHYVDYIGKLRTK